MMSSKFVVLCTKLSGPIRLGQSSLHCGPSLPILNHERPVKQRLKNLTAGRSTVSSLERRNVSQRTTSSLSNTVLSPANPFDHFLNISSNLSSIEKVGGPKLGINLQVLTLYWTHCLNVVFNKFPEVFRPRFFKLQKRAKSNAIGDEAKGIISKDMPGKKETAVEAKKKEGKDAAKKSDKDPECNDILSKIVQSVCGSPEKTKEKSLSLGEPKKATCPPPEHAAKCCPSPCLCVSATPACAGGPSGPMPSSSQGTPKNKPSSDVTSKRVNSSTPSSCPPPEKTIKKLKSRCCPKPCKPPPPACPPAPPVCTPSPCLPICRPPGNPPCPGACPCPPAPPSCQCPCPTPCCFPQMEALQYDPECKTLNFFMLNAPTSIHKDEILVQVVYSGVAQSDIQIMEGVLPCRNCPTILGHEFSGVACAIGSAVTHVKCGDCIAVDPYAPCHICRFCTKGKYIACPTHGLNDGIGIYKDGGWAEFVVVDKNQVYRVPPSISLDHAALLQPLSCIVSGYYSIDLHVGQNVLIQGLGVMGSLWAAMLHFQGHRTVAVTDMCESKRKQFENLCLDYCIVTPEQACELHPDVVIDCTGSTVSLERAVDLLNPRGQLCIFGTPGPCDEAKIKPYELARKEIRLVGVYGGTYSFSKAIDIMELLGCRYLDYNKLGIHTFQFGQYEGAFKLKKSGEVNKIMFKVDSCPR